MAQIILFLYQETQINLEELVSSQQPHHLSFHHICSQKPRGLEAAGGTQGGGEGDQGWGIQPSPAAGPPETPLQGGHASSMPCPRSGRH